MERLIVKHLKAYYQNKKSKTQVLDDVSFSLEDGKIIVILGPSGCGKTTLLKCIAGFVEYEGDITLSGIDNSRLSVKNKNLAYVSQSFTTYSYLNVYNNLALPLKASKIDADEIDKRINQIAKELDIDYLLTRKPKYLSFGQCQKVSIARAIIKNPDLFLFDEPFSNLDATNRIELRKIVKDIKEKYNKAMVFVTHDINDALYLADTIVILDQGKIVQQGTIDDILKNPINDFVKSFISNAGKENE